MLSLRIRVAIGLLGCCIGNAGMLSAQALGAWQSEAVPSTKGKPASLSTFIIDKLNNFHIEYATQTSGLNYAYRASNGKQWNTTTVDENGSEFSGLAVDSAGHPHIAYDSKRSAGLHYAFWDGQRWRTFLIDPVTVNGQVSIRLDSADRPSISYYRDVYEDHRPARYAKYANFDGKTWFVQTVDHRRGTGRWNSLVLDTSGVPSIAYSFPGTAAPAFAHLEKSAWNLSLVTLESGRSKPSFISYNSIAIGSDGEPRIAYLDVTSRSLHYVWRQDAAWHAETFDSLVASGAEAEQVSLQLDRKGQPHVAYFDSGLGAVKYATRDDRGWHTEIVDDARGFASLCLDADDQPHIAYLSRAQNEIHIAQRAHLSVH